MNKYYQKLLRDRRKLFDKDWNCKDWDALEKIDEAITEEKERCRHNLDLFFHCINGDNFDEEKFLEGARD